MLSADLKVIKSISRAKTDLYVENIIWFENDGFIDIEMTEQGNHTNRKYRVYRYDRCLNLMWISDVEANFIFYFKSPEGNIWTYKSMWEPERECYVEYYGSEDAYRTQHTHSLTYVEKVAPTCLDIGCEAYWFCEDCGCYYSDEGYTLILDATVLYSPANGHTEEIIPAIESTCSSWGASEGLKCAICDVILIEPIPAGPLMHQYSSWQTVKQSTCIQSGLKAQTCSLCGDQKTMEIAPDYKRHQYVEIPAVEPTCTTSGSTRGEKCSICNQITDEPRYIDALGHGEASRAPIDPTCTEEGLSEGRYCWRCNEILIEQETIPAKGHTEIVDTAVDATCTANGKTEGKHCSVCGEVLITQEILPATGDHNYGEWVVTKEATVEAEGEESRNCAVCNAVESRAIAKLPPEETDTKEVITEKPVVETSADSQTDTEQQTKDVESGCQGAIGVGMTAMISFISAFAVLLLKKREE